MKSLRCTWLSLCLPICLAVLAGIVMPDTPRPQRYERSQLESYAGQAKQRITEKKPLNPGAAAVRQEAASRKKVRQADRSNRIVLPRQRLR